MNYTTLHEVLNLVECFESSTDSSSQYEQNVNGFRKWIADNLEKTNTQDHAAPDWEGKDEGRTPESVISTLLVHLNRYARSYSKAAILGSNFSTQEDFIYLINLKAFGQMTKMELIKKNIQDKPAGMQTINRLIGNGWVVQKDSSTDRRSKLIRITDAGVEALDRQMDKIRQATRIVTGNLNNGEKMELIRLLDKLDRFHKPVYQSNIDSSDLLEHVMRQLPQEN